MPLTETLNQKVRRELNSGTCPHCGRSKADGKSVCPTCWKWLPPKIQRALYRAFSDDYVTAHEDALLHLQCETDIPAKPKPCPF